jgi:hypothetical protein
VQSEDAAKPYRDQRRGAEAEGVARRRLGRTQHCPGSPAPPFWSVKRPARPYKSATQTQFTVVNAKGAWPPRAGPDGSSQRGPPRSVTAIPRPRPAATAGSALAPPRPATAGSGLRVFALAQQYTPRLASAARARVAAGAKTCGGGGGRGLRCGEALPLEQRRA